MIFSFDFPMFVKAWATHPIAQLILMDGFDVIHAVYLEKHIKHEIKDKMLTLSSRTAYISQWYHLVSGSKQKWGSYHILCSTLSVLLRSLPYTHKMDPMGNYHCGTHFYVSEKAICLEYIIISLPSIKFSLSSYVLAYQVSHMEERLENKQQFVSDLQKKALVFL